LNKKNITQKQNTQLDFQTYIKLFNLCIAPFGRLSYLISIEILNLSSILEVCYHIYFYDWRKSVLSIALIQFVKWDSDVQYRPQLCSVIWGGLWTPLT